MQLLSTFAEGKSLCYGWHKHRSRSQEVWVYLWPPSVTLDKSSKPLWASAYLLLDLLLDKCIEKCCYSGHHSSESIFTFKAMGMLREQAGEDLEFFFHKETALVTSPSSMCSALVLQAFLQGVSVTLYADGCRPTSFYLTPHLRLWGNTTSPSLWGNSLILCPDLSQSGYIT